MTPHKYSTACKSPTCRSSDLKKVKSTGSSKSASNGKWLVIAKPVSSPPAPQLRPLMLEPKLTSSLHYHCAPTPQSRPSALIFKPPHHVLMPHHKHPPTLTLSTTLNPLIYYALSLPLPDWKPHLVSSGAAPLRPDIDSFKSIYLMNLSSHLVSMPQYRPQTHLHLSFCLKT